MAASAVTVAFSSSIVAAPSALSSHSAFSSTPVVSVAPRSSIAARNGSMIVRASTSEEPRAARREMVAGLIAAGAALASAGSAWAASGPGIQGAKKTAKRADELLKAGDDLINNDSPPRFGDSRVEGSLKDASKVAQQAGSGAVEGLQDGASKTIEGAKENVTKAGDRLGNLVKGNKSGDVAINSVEEAASNVRGGVDDLLSNGPAKVESDVRRTGDKVKDDLASTRGLGRQASNKAENVVAQAQDKASDAAEASKGFFGDLKDKLTDAIPQ